MTEKKQRVEIHYIKLNTALILAAVSLLAGFLGGVVYSTYKAGSHTSGQQVFVPPSPEDAQDFLVQQKNRIKELEREVSANPNNLDAWQELGNLYFDTHDFQNAIRAYEKYIELKPDNPHVWTDLGIMYRRSGQPEKAVACFNKAIEINPRHEQSRFNKGIVLMYDLKDSEAAIKAWKELAKINPSFRAPGGMPIQEFIKNQ